MVQVCFPAFKALTIISNNKIQFILYNNHWKKSVLSLSNYKKHQGLKNKEAQISTFRFFLPASKIGKDGT